jgi:hypothetical protein
LDPVEIYPTQTQIENATRVVLYRDILEPRNTSCPISLETFHDNETVTVIRECGHIFHSGQLIQWFRSNCRCPICRYDIRNYLVRNNTPQVNNRSNEEEEEDQEQDQEQENEYTNDEPPTNEPLPNPNPNPNPNIDMSSNTINTINNINTITDNFINNFLNTYTGNDNLYDTLYLDIVFDPSYNYVNNTNFQTRYYRFPSNNNRRSQ